MGSQTALGAMQRNVMFRAPAAQLTAALACCSRPQLRRECDAFDWRGPAARRGKWTQEEDETTTTGPTDTDAEATVASLEATREEAGVILRPVRTATIEGAEETSNKVRIEDTRSEGNASIADVEKSWECLVEAKGDY